MTDEVALWARSPHVASVQEGTRAVLLDLGAPEAAHPRALIGPAAVIWGAMAQPRSLDEICRSVERLLIEPHPGLRDQTADFLARLASEGLVTCTHQETPSRPT